jgi:HEAT repeat protein
MLEDLDSIPWAELEHAYGSAEDIPPLIRALLSPDGDERENAQFMLYMGPLHQGTVTSSVPPIARFLIEMLEDENTPDRAWMARFLGSAAGVCDSCVDIDYDAIPKSIQEKFASRDPEVVQQEAELHTQLCDVLRNSFSLFIELLTSPDVGLRATIPVLLARLNCKDTSQQKTFINQLASETDEKVRAVLVFCLGKLFDEAAVDRRPYLSTLLSDQHEPVTVRLAAGFAMINAFRKQNTSDDLQQFAELVGQYPDELMTLDTWHQDEMSGLSKLWPYDRLLDGFHFLNKDQKLVFIPAIQQLHAYTLRNRGIGSGYVETTLRELQK